MLASRLRSHAHPLKYIALLRGINVGGQNMIKMAALKTCLEQQRFENVATFIASGNVIFESPERRAPKLRFQVETALSRTFAYEARIVLRSQAQLKRVVSQAPRDWQKRKDIRCNVMFLREPVTPRDVIPQIKLAPGVDSVQPGPGVVYCTTLLSGVKQSRFTRVIGTPIYREMTIRTYNTCRKILDLMEQ